MLCDLRHLKIPKRLKDINADDQKSLLHAYQAMLDCKGSSTNGVYNVQFSKQLLGIQHLSKQQLATLTRKVAERNAAAQKKKPQKNG